jgi:hypothetical protein
MENGFGYVGCHIGKSIISKNIEIYILEELEGWFHQFSSVFEISTTHSKYDLAFKISRIITT